MTEKEIVQALRCRARHEKARNEGCKKCPYWATENLEEWQKLCGWASCKVYQIISDAADAIERLTAENAALRELAAADKEGRVVVLPCKVGDTVYFVNAKQILEFAVVGYAVDETGISWVHSEHVDKTGHTNERTFSPDRFGKNTFLTREEAERAMEGKKDG
jgi:hypothetical protein